MQRRKTIHRRVFQSRHWVPDIIDGRREGRVVSSQNVRRVTVRYTISKQQPRFQSQLHQEATQKNSVIFSVTQQQSDCLLWKQTSSFQRNIDSAINAYKTNFVDTFGRFDVLLLTSQVSHTLKWPNKSAPLVDTGISDTYRAIISGVGVSFS